MCRCVTMNCAGYSHNYLLVPGKTTASVDGEAHVVGFVSNLASLKRLPVLVLVRVVVASVLGHACLDPGKKHLLG